MSAASARASLASEPGRLVLVVGPSGAGKDTLIRAARDGLADDELFVFLRRVITRPASPDEDNIVVDADGFTALAGQGALAATWDAHGLRYGLPAELDHHVAAGRVVVVNVSRAVVEELRARYRGACVIEVTAPPDVLASRLAERARGQDGDLARRLRRSEEIEPPQADFVIDNGGDVRAAAAAFIRALRGGDPATRRA